jgi:hypothetical protein
MAGWVKVAILAAIALSAYLYGRMHEARVGADRLSEYTARVAEEGAEAIARQARRAAAAERITTQKEIEHAKELAAALDAGWRERVRDNARARGHVVPRLPDAPARADGPAAVAVAPGAPAAPEPGAGAAEELEAAVRAYWSLAEQCTVTTVMLVNLQEWTASQAGLDP